jgi:hypothetical protein
MKKQTAKDDIKRAREGAQGSSGPSKDEHVFEVIGDYLDELFDKIGRERLIHGIAYFIGLAIIVGLLGKLFGWW